MDNDEGKLFIGGIAWDTTEEKLNQHFDQYGHVSQTVIMYDKTTGRPRGFGFVIFSDPSVLDRVLQDTHTIDGRTVEAKRARSREEQNSYSRTGNFNSGRSLRGESNSRTRKIFVGGLPATLTEDEFRQYFGSYGNVTDVVIMYDQNTQRPRGFGFITFDTEDAVDNVLQKNFHELNNKLVEVKRALPKDSGSGGRAAGYQGFDASDGNAGVYEGRADGNLYMQPQNSGGFPHYAAYGAPSYGYGAVPGMGYGGYGNYGFGGYGNPNTGFGTGVPGAMKNTWMGQTPSGYGANAGYGAFSAPMGQPQSSASGYGNQGYGYGNGNGSDGYSGGYGTNGGSNGNALNNGAGGGEQQGKGDGYAGNGYGDSNGSGYSNAMWGSDPSQTAGGHGGTEARQAQQ